MIAAEQIRRRLAAIRGRIRRACERAGRDTSQVVLVAVTKTHPAGVVRAAIEAGLSDFGENRVQEGAAKIEALRGEFPGLHWRLIGQLQTNKAKTALQYFEEIQSVDRLPILEKLAAAARAAGRKFPIYLEVNIGDEESKGGAPLPALRELLRDAMTQEELEVRGLMAVPPFTPDPEGARTWFRQIARLRDDLRQETGAPLRELSMGMSHDFDIAIEEGSTVVRLGTALFGARETG